MRWQSRIIGLLLTLGVTARLLWFFYDPSLWNDEAALVNSIVRYGPFRLIARPLDGLQIAPPGYLLLEKLTGGLGGYSEASLRVVSLVCGIVALALFIVLARSWLSGWGRVAAIALFSLSGPLIYHSSEAKQYEAAVLVTILLLVIAFRWRTQWSPVRALAAGVLGMIGILLASTAIFVLVGAFGVLALDFLFTRRWRQAAYVGTGLALAGGAFLLEYVLLFRHNPNVQVMNAYWAPHFAPLPLSAADLRWYVRTGFFALITPLGLSLDLSLPFLPHHMAAKYLLATAWPAIPLIGVGISAALRKDRVAGAILLSCLAATLVAAVFHKYPINDRLELFLVPVVYLLIAAAVEQVQSPGWSIHRRRAVAVLAAWLMIYLAVNFGAKLPAPYRFGSNNRYSQMREAIRFVEENKQPKDLVFLVAGTANFYRYYNFRNRLDWTTQKGQDPRVGARSAGDVTRAIQRQIRSVLSSRHRAWFLVQTVMSPVTFRDERGVAHRTSTPTGTLYQRILHDQEDACVGLTYRSPSAAAYLLTECGDRRPSGTHS